MEDEDIKKAMEKNLFFRTNEGEIIFVGKDLLTEEQIKNLKDIQQKINSEKK